MPTRKKSYSLDELIEINKEIKDTLNKHKRYLNSFKNDDGTFFATVKKKDKINLTSTTTCTTSLINAKKDEELGKIKEKLFNLLLKQEWTSAKLKPYNCYTTTMILYGLHKLNPDLKYDNAPEKIKKSLDGIKTKINYKNNDGGLNVLKYPTNAFVTLMGFLSYEAFKGKEQVNKDLSVGIKWFEKELYRQISLFYANDDYEKDVYKLSYSLIALLKYKEDINNTLVNKVFSIIFNDQKENGSWDKYNPLFHYPEVGNAYCYPFEMLKNLFLIPQDYHNVFLNYISNFEKARKWILNHELKNRTDHHISGWCSYHHSNWRNPESWATATVFDFLCGYNNIIERLIRKNLLENFKAKRDFPTDHWNNLKDIEMIVKEKELKLKNIIEENIINKIINGRDIDAYGIFFFGPPATGKTHYAKGIAEKLKWPLITLNPSHFLTEGFAGIVRRASKIFKKLEHLQEVVVLFDEMDELIKSRPGLTEFESRLFTTSMLPMIADLHDMKNLIYIFNTNFYGKIDEAIKRPGRFDFLLCLGPPCIEDLIVLFTENIKKFSINEVQLNLILDFLNKNEIQQKLKYFLYFEILDLARELYNLSLNDTSDFSNKISITFEKLCRSIYLNRENNLEVFQKEKKLSIINARK